MSDDHRERHAPIPQGISGTDVRTFLIADVRGYTTYTRDHGDEAAAALASTFADLVRDVVEAREGSLLELRGDEALVVFVSARQALRAAVDLQSKFAEAKLPRGVGIGLDAGEAVPVGEGYRGGALNLAARLCSQAKPGQILASEGVIHLAAKVEGIAYLDPQTFKLKGYREPVRAVEVLSQERVRHGALQRIGRRTRRAAARPVFWGAAAVVIAGIVLLAALLPGVLGGNPTAPSPSPGVPSGDKLVRIATSVSRITAVIPVGSSPADVTTGAGSVWVASSGDGTVYRIDPVTNKVVARIKAGREPKAIGFDGTHIWVADRLGSAIYEIDPGSNRLVATIPLDTRPVSIAFAAGAVFVGGQVPSGGMAPIIRIDKATHETTEIGRFQAAPGSDTPSCVLVAGREEAAWATDRVGRIVKLDPTTGRQVGAVDLNDPTYAISAGASGLWVLTPGFPAKVRLLDVSSLHASAEVPVGSTPVAFSSGECIRARPAMDEADGFLWVTNLGDGTVSKVDVNALHGVTTVEVGKTLTGVAADFGSVWVTVCGGPTCYTAVEP